MNLSTTTAPAIAAVSTKAEYLSRLKLALPHIGVKSKLYIGVALALSSSIFIGLSLIIKKRGLQQAAAKGGVNEFNIEHRKINSKCKSQS